ncbi:MAG: hypothetical protein Aurels2KO_48290 [Aureliella sp.]
MFKRSIACYVSCHLLLVCAGAWAGEDWPMWRADASRSASSPNSLPARFDLLWSQKFEARQQAWDDPLNLDLMTYDRVFEPIVVDGRMFVGFNDQSKLVALDTLTGKTLWTFYAEAPVRLAPAVSSNKLYLCSDDGYLYCLQASSGDLLWKFRGGPNSQHAIGNRRLSSAWPARGGPVVFEDTVYFAASIWPFMGTFIYALDCESGDVKWVNDSTGSQYIKQPHSAPSFAGVAPQGALVATEDLLVVPGGRSVPAVFDRATGELKYFEINAGGKGTGGSFVTADSHYFYVHTREKGTRAFDLKTGVKTAFTPNEPVLADGILYSAAASENGPVIQAFAVDDDSRAARKPIWEIHADGTGDLILAGGKLVAAGSHTISIVDISVAGRVPEVTAAAKLPAETSVARVLVADQKLFAISTDGDILAFGVADSGSRPSIRENVSAEGQAEQKRTSEIVAQFSEHGSLEGYAFWFGDSDQELLRKLERELPFEQLAVVDPEPARIDALRRRVDRVGLHGRITGHVAVPTDFRAPKYVAHMVFVAPTSDEGDLLLDQQLRAIYESVRPYGGSMVLLAGERDRNALGEAVEAMKLEQSDVTVCSLGVVVRRVGALPGSADWTHQYGDVANTIKSDDKRVKLPLGILWFGGSSNMDVLPRHGHGPPEQVVGGRLFIQGMNCLSARDVYTGRVLWKREFEDLGTFDVYYDATYENSPLNPKYNQVHIPGANGRGTNYVVTEDRVYILDGATCLMLDPASGDEVGRVELPKDEQGNQPEWGYLGVYEDVLLGGLGFANYREQHSLKFEKDAELKASRAGFGSKSFDLAASRALVAFDRHTGHELWRVDANHSFWHNGIVAGGGRVYCLDKNPTQIEEAMRRRGLAMPETYRILCLDAATGESKWEVKDGIFGTWLGYSEEHDLLLQAGAQASDRLYAEVGRGMRIYHASTGSVKWKNDGLKYAGPCILHNDLIITNANSYSESAGAFYIDSGRQKMVKNPVTGAIQPWKMTRAYGCNNIIASENMLTFRSGAAGFYDLLSDSGTGNLGGFKSGCTSNLVVANGVLNAPDYTRTCSCGYQNQTSLALVHMPDIDMWSVNALAKPSQLDPKVESLGINFGAPGDRRDDEGTLWLEFPLVGGDSAPLNVKVNEEAEFYQHHSSTFGSSDLGWVAASGVDGISRLSIDLDLAPQVDLAKGLPVANPQDDAEEREGGSVSLTSSDLELVDDGGAQVVGLRFQRVPLNRSAKIREAYVQFTCDEASDEATQLFLAGELSANASQFESVSHDVSSRDRTKAEVAWQVAPWKKPGASGAEHRSPDLSAIVQEIVNQPDWRKDNALAMLITGEGKRVAVSAKGSGAGAAKLIVIADSTGADELAHDLGPTTDYDVQLLVANRRGSPRRVFDIYVEGKRRKQNVIVGDYNAGAELVRISLSPIPVRGPLDIELRASEGEPILSGVKISRSELPTSGRGE